MLAWFAGLGESFYNIGSSLITWVWDGIKSVWESVVSWVQEKIAWLEEKLSFWKSSQEKMSSSSSNSDSSIDGSHANGLSYVPFDGYKALLHKGERVLTAKENAEYSGANNTTTTNATAQDNSTNIHVANVSVQANKANNLSEFVNQLQLISMNR